MKFNKQLIFFDSEGYNEAMKMAERKLSALDKCRMEALKHIELDDLKAFEQDMLTYVKQRAVSANKAVNGLGLSIDNSVLLIGLNWAKLSDLSQAYYSLSEQVEWKDGVPYVLVDKERFERYTSNEEQNKKWELVKAFIDSAHALQKEHPTMVRIGAFQVATNNLCVGDIRTNRLFPNVQYILN